MIENNYHTDVDVNVQDLVDRIASSPENYRHLKIFLSRVGMPHCFRDKEFLMVSPTSFGKIELLDVGVEANDIILEILDCKTKAVGNVRIDVNGNKPQVFFICWQDIKRMVLDEVATKYSSDELLEFDF